MQNTQGDAAGKITSPSHTLGEKKAGMPQLPHQVPARWQKWSMEAVEETLFTLPATHISSATKAGTKCLSKDLDEIHSRLGNFPLVATGSRGRTHTFHCPGHCSPREAMEGQQSSFASTYLNELCYDCLKSQPFLSSSVKSDTWHAHDCLLTAVRFSGHSLPHPTQTELFSICLHLLSNIKLHCNWSNHTPEIPMKLTCCLTLPSGFFIIRFPTSLCLEATTCLRQSNGQILHVPFMSRPEQYKYAIIRFPATCGGLFSFPYSQGLFKSESLLYCSWSDLVYFPPAAILPMWIQKAKFSKAVQHANYNQITATLISHSFYSSSSQVFGGTNMPDKQSKLLQDRRQLCLF